MSEHCEHRWWHAQGETWRDAVCLFCGVPYVAWCEAVKELRIEEIERTWGRPDQG